MTTATDSATGMPMDYCHQGSILRQTERDWTAFAYTEKRQAQRSEQRRIVARRRRELHDSCCPRCGGNYHA